MPKNPVLTQWHETGAKTTPKGTPGQPRTTKNGTLRDVFFKSCFPFFIGGGVLATLRGCNLEFGITSENKYFRGGIPHILKPPRTAPVRAILQQNEHEEQTARAISAYAQ